MAGGGEGTVPSSSRVPKFFPSSNTTSVQFTEGANPMKNARRLTIMGLLLCGVLVLAANSWAQKRPPILEQVAKTYGLDSFGQVDAIRYTFNLQFPGVNLSRTWIWEPKTGKVSYEGTDKDVKPVKATYLRSQLSSQPDNVKNQIDPGFVNDNYWLIFPFHACCDTSATLTHGGMHKLPIAKGSPQQVAPNYPSDPLANTPRPTSHLYLVPAHP